MFSLDRISSIPSFTTFQQSNCQRHVSGIRRIRGHSLPPWYSFKTGGGCTSVLTSTTSSSTPIFSIFRGYAPSCTCTALRRTHYGHGCVYCLQSYTLCSWLCVLPKSIRTMFLVAYIALKRTRTTFLAACTAFKRTYYVPDCVSCLKASALCSCLRVLP